MNPPSTQHLFIINLFTMRACFTSVLFFLFYAAITAWNYTTVKLETTEFIEFEFLEQTARYYAFLAQLHSCSNIGSDISITRPFNPTHQHTVTEKEMEQNLLLSTSWRLPSYVEMLKTSDQEQLKRVRESLHVSTFRIN